MPKVRSGTIVAALTTAALAGVGVLAWQASAAQQHAGAAHPDASATGSGHHGATPAEIAARKARELPAGSGTGRRVVYSLARHRVWLVAAGGTVSRTYEVASGTVSPAPGTYPVTTAGRTAATTGTDGTPIEHIVLFTSAQGVVVGFSSADDGAFPTPDPAKKTGGIREHLADGDAMWTFATAGTKVVVVR